MNFKEALRFFYGLTMGTSTPFLKPTKRHLFPTRKVEISSNVGALLGGTGANLIVQDGSRAFVVNSNQGEATRQLKDWVHERGATKIETLIWTSLLPEFSGESASFAEVPAILIGDYDAGLLQRRWKERPANMSAVREERVLRLDSEEIRVVPVGRAQTHKDLVVVHERTRTLYAGGLFYNCVHPVLSPADGLDVQSWIVVLEGLLERFNPVRVIGAEGDVGTPEDARRFLAYLHDLRDPVIEFQECRRRYDWTEIPSSTSLEENFDLLREKVKSHTTL